MAKKYLILTNGYPSNDDLYKNGFIHRRVKLYFENNIDVDIFYLFKNPKLVNYDFDGVSVYRGNQDILEIFLSNNTYDKVLIHFVNESMINALDKVCPTLEKIIWIHGFEAERWTRRKFNYSDEELKVYESKLNSNDIVKFNFLRSIYSNPNNTFIFISNFHKNACEEDAMMKINNYHIIPNVIDERLFDYTPKDIHMRKNILILRPFKYHHQANDLSIKAILELSKKSYFKDLSFSIYGMGWHFDDIVKPVRDFENVKIYNTFIPQPEISKIHKEHGIFLCPSRKDSQGVSIGEAMSSGLVPVTSNVDAIGEFVDLDCGFLADFDDYIGLSHAIEKLYFNPDLFKLMSKKASSSITQKCGCEISMSKELNLIRQ